MGFFRFNSSSVLARKIIPGKICLENSFLIEQLQVDALSYITPPRVVYEASLYTDATKSGNVDNRRVLNGGVHRSGDGIFAVVP